jgi:hypothetical protein
MSRMKIRIVFVAVHFVVFATIVVLLSYGAYPEVMGRFMHQRSELVQEIYDEVNAYREEQGAYPTSLDPLLHIEEDGLFFQSNLLDGWSFSFHKDPNALHKVIRYRLIDDEPVIFDLGRDANEGGFDPYDIDVAYPPKYQKQLSFRDFTKTMAFQRSLLFGILFSGGISACLLGMWARRYPNGRPPASVIGVSILFVLFEIFLLNIILYGHIYPTH